MNEKQLKKKLLALRAKVKVQRKREVDAKKAHTAAQRAYEKMGVAADKADERVTKEMDKSDRLLDQIQDVQAKIDAAKNRPTETQSETQPA